MKKAYVNTIFGSAKLTEGFGRATLLLHGGTLLIIDNALYGSKSHKNLLSSRLLAKMTIMLRLQMKER